MTNYEKYRGKCKEYVDALILERPELRAVRGHYDCPLWGRQAHWWAEDEQGNVIDPTVKQFPSGGLGEYVEFDGFVVCAECGKRIPEEHADIDGNYAFCSTRCHGRFVGVFV